MTYTITFIHNEEIHTSKIQPECNDDWIEITLENALCVDVHFHRDNGTICVYPVVSTAEGKTTNTDVLLGRMCINTTSFDEFTSKYGGLITDPFSDGDSHWENIGRAAVAACSDEQTAGWLRVWKTEKRDNQWFIKPLSSPSEFNEAPIGTFWVTEKRREENTQEEEYLWVVSQN